MLQQTIEMCVPPYHYVEAAKVRDAQQHLLERLERQVHTLHMEDQRHCSRYRYVTSPILDVLLFPDEKLGLNLLEQVMVSKLEHQAVFSFFFSSFPFLFPAADLQSHRYHEWLSSVCE